MTVYFLSVLVVISHRLFCSRKPGIKYWYYSFLVDNKGNRKIYLQNKANRIGKIGKLLSSY